MDWLLLLFSYSCLFHVFPYCVYKIESKIMQDFDDNHCNNWLVLISFIFFNYFNLLFNRKKPKFFVQQEEAQVFFLLSLSLCFFLFSLIIIIIIIIIIMTYPVQVSVAQYPRQYSLILFYFICQVFNIFLFFVLGLIFSNVQVYGLR